MAVRFTDRRDAGYQLAQKLLPYKEQKETVVLALPRGGVAVAAEIAKELHLPLDLMLVRKLGVPGDEEFAFGAIAMGGVVFINEDTVNLVGLSLEQIDGVITREKKELERRNAIYRKGAPPPNLKGQTVILVDDGMATGADMRVAVNAARQLGAKEIVVAVPVSSDSAYDMLKHEADQVICLQIPSFFMGVGSFYQSFAQMEDEEVLALMEDARQTFSSIV